MMGSPVQMDGGSTLVGTLEVKVMHGRLFGGSIYSNQSVIVQFEYRGRSYRTGESTSEDPMKPLWEHKLMVPIHACNFATTYIKCVCIQTYINNE